MMRVRDALACILPEVEEDAQSRRVRERDARARWWADLPAIPEDMGTPAQRALWRARRAHVRHRLDDVAPLDLACDTCGTRLIDEGPGMATAALLPKFTAICLGCGWSVFLTTQLRRHVWLIDQET